MYAYEEIQKKGKKGMPNRDEIIKSNVNFADDEAEKLTQSDDKKHGKILTKV